MHTMAYVIVSFSKTFATFDIPKRFSVTGSALRGEPCRERRERRSSVSRSESEIVWKTWEIRFCAHELAKIEGQIDLWRFIGKIIEQETVRGYNVRCSLEAPQATQAYQAAGAKLSKQGIRAEMTRRQWSHWMPRVQLFDVMWIHVHYTTNCSSPNLKYQPLGNNFPKQTFVPHKISKPVCNKNSVHPSESFRVLFPGKSRHFVTGACHSWPWRPPGCEGARSCCAWAWRPWGATNVDMLTCLTLTQRKWFVFLYCRSVDVDAILMGGTVVLALKGCNYRGEALLKMAFVEVFLFFGNLK